MGAIIGTDLNRDGIPDALQPQVMQAPATYPGTLIGGTTGYVGGGTLIGGTTGYVGGGPLIGGTTGGYVSGGTRIGGTTGGYVTGGRVIGGATGGYVTGGTVIGGAASSAFNALDRNGDGVITRAEFNSAVRPTPVYR